MDELLKKKKVIQSKLNRLIAKLEELKKNPLKIPEVEVYEQNACSLGTEIDCVSEGILTSCKDKDFERYEIEMHDVLNTLDSVKIGLRTLRTSANALDESVPKSNSSSCPHEKGTVQLPKIELPTFSGNLLDWISYRDLFNASVDSKENLSPAQKLQYLKLSLTGEAAALLQSLQISDANYEKAKKTLSERYENESELIHAALDKLFTQPNIHHESATQLRRLLDTTTQCVGALEIMKQPVEHWDSVLIYILKRKLDPETLKQWMLTQSNSPAKFGEFKQFIDQRARALSSLSGSQVTSKPKPKVGGGFQKETKGHAMTHHVANSVCAFCKDNHSIYKCSKFQNLSLSDRLSAVYKNKLCANCLRTGHFKTTCSSPGCKVCKSKHHSMLHRWDMKKSSKVEQENKKVVSNHSLDSPNIKQVLLPTCNIIIIDRRGAPQTCRALIDSGSQSSFITENCVQTLGLKRMFSKLQVTGISPDKSITTNGTVNVNLRSCVQECCVSVNLHILSKISCNLPQTSINTRELHCFNLLKLADPNYSRPSSIDLLLGADVVADIFLEGQLKAPNSNILAQETKFGWIVFGSTTAKPVNGPCITVHHSAAIDDDSLKKFWELEEVPDVKILTLEEQKCEGLFQSTHTRNEEGRFVVCLPFRENGELGHSRDVAVKRLIQNERRFSKKQHLADDYHKFMEDYLRLGHMELIQDSELSAPEGSYFYLPHHAVPNKAGDKFRVVFDGSAKTSTGLSLNDKLMVGPQLQADLVSLLLRFRTHKIALVADIEKMYRQVLMRDSDFQRIVLRDDPSKPIKDYRLVTVTYGTASAPYLAVKSLQQLAKDEQLRFGEAAQVVLNDFYVDDLLTGAQTQTEAMNLMNALVQLLSEGGFPLKKWASNDPKVLEAVPFDFHASKDSLQMNFDDSVKTLGIMWHPSTDVFSFKSDLKPPDGDVTKRQLLSLIARLFDPLGWISPITIRCKILMQEVWKTNIIWDEILPHSLQEDWCVLKRDLVDIEKIQIPRFVLQSELKVVELHGFSDASEKAYAAAIYIRCVSSCGAVSVHLIISKTRVAPLKTISVPRLELCGALLLANLMSYVSKTLSSLSPSTYYWTDSTIVLCWLKSEPSRWKTFVANRVSKIQDLSPAANWHHVTGENNPADLATRGLSPSNLNISSWLKGPDFLYDYPVAITTFDPMQTPEELPEQRAQTVLVVNAKPNDSEEIDVLIKRFSALATLKRVIAYCLRFIHNCKTPHEKRKGYLTTTELKQSLMTVVKCVQRLNFADEIYKLERNQEIPRKSKLLSLHPFLDCSGVLRVGGRLRHADRSEDAKHPVLIPSKHYLTELLIWEYHKINLHAGPQLTQASLQQQFWIVAARKEVRRVLQKCITCIRQAAPTTQQMMGDLPSPRTRPSRPFLHTGMDYAGPFIIRMSKTSKGKTCKAYLALFICFSTKAIHCELVSDLSTPAFLAALKRFISRRGKPSDLYSDCGTNFIGAHREIKELYALYRSSAHNETVARQLANENINWHFNPPASPHMGGLWEAGIKSVKYHLKRIISRHVVLTFEELYTLICQVEASLNSRPLCPMSSDPNDLSALTPGHFLIGEPLNAIPEPDYTPLKVNRLSRWQLIQRLFQHFWARWKAEYLGHLQNRSKWHRIRPNLKTGDLVILKDDRVPPMQWKLGRVMEVYEGPDGVVRVVDVKTAEGLVKRNVQKLCILPIESKDD